MNRFLQMIMLFGLLDAVDSGAGGGGAAVADPAPVDPTPASDPTPAAAPVSDPAPAATDLNDPMAALNAAMEAVLPKDEPVTPPTTPEAPAVPEAFAQALQISEFVKSPEHVEAAIRAADEVWNVATGKTPASSLLEGMRAANPQGFASVVENLTQYIEQVTGKKLGEAPTTPPDPSQARLDALEKAHRDEQEARQQAAYQQQVGAARTKALEFITSKTKGTFAEGQEAYMLQQAGAKAGIPEDQMVQALLSGKTDKLETAYKAVVKDETARIKAYNANLIKQHRALANAVPASGAVAAKGDPKSLLPLPGESPAQQTKRLMDNGLL